MTISSIELYKYSIPMVPFTIATGTMEYAQNIFIRIHTSDGITGMGECSAFPMIAAETQATCFEMAKDFARLWKGKDPLEIEERLYDIASRKAGVPLYQYLGGQKKKIESDLTIGISDPASMAATALEFKEKGVKMIKVKLGKEVFADIQRIKLIREAVGPEIILRIDANQGWSYDDAVTALTGMETYQIQFCEQPMRKWNDELLPSLCEISGIPLMADESVFTHYDAQRLIRNKACDYINIKLAKSGGIREAIRINQVAEQNNIPCMLGGMLESRMALTAKVHFAMAHDNIRFYDLDTCLLGHKEDPVIGGVQYNGMELILNDGPGIGADVDPVFFAKHNSTTCII
jgi:L-Ala-D/L-Glu epimerase